MRLLAAPDKFRGTLTARAAAAAIAAGAERAGWTAVELPLADGGEGTLDVLGGGNRRTAVTGPLGEPVEAAWRLEDDGTALIEAAQACGLTLAGGPEGNDPLRATSRGVGELVAAAVAAGRDRIVVTRRRRRLDRRWGRRPEALPASAPRPARGRVRRRRALPRRGRRLRAAEGSDAGAGADPARPARAARRPRPPRLRRRGRARGRPRGDRRAPPPRLRLRRRPARLRRAASRRRISS